MIVVFVAEAGPASRGHQEDNRIQIGADHWNETWMVNTKYLPDLLSSPGPKPLILKPFSSKTKTKGPWADTKML